MGFWTCYAAECTNFHGYQLNRLMLQEKLPLGINRCDLHNMLNGLLLVIRNGHGTVPLHVLMMRAEPTPEPSESRFENGVQDILGC